MFDKWKQTASKLKKDLKSIIIAYRYPETPWYAKVTALLVIAYGASPLDLIPDFIPFFGYLDDLIILPLGIKLATRLIPKEVMNKARHDSVFVSTVSSLIKLIGIMIVIGIWSIVVALVVLAII